MRIKIGNVKNGDKGVYIGRPNPRYGESPLGNPYTIGKDGTRSEVVAKYRSWLWDRIEEKGAVYQELVKLLTQAQLGEELTLVCWCAPKGCHGDVVMAAIEWLEGEI